MALTRRRLQRWHVVALALVACCGAWAAFRELVRLQPPPLGWEDALAGTWRAVHPVPLAGKVELHFAPPDRGTLVGAGRIAPALHDLHGVWPYIDDRERLARPIEEARYATSNVAIDLWGAEEGERWGPPAEGAEPLRQGLVTLATEHGAWQVFAYSVRGELLLRLSYVLDRDITDIRHVVFRKVAPGLQESQ